MRFLTLFRPERSASDISGSTENDAVQMPRMPSLDSVPISRIPSDILDLPTPRAVAQSGSVNSTTSSSSSNSTNNNNNNNRNGSSSGGGGGGGKVNSRSSSGQVVAVSSGGHVKTREATFAPAPIVSRVKPVELRTDTSPGGTLARGGGSVKDTNGSSGSRSGAGSPSEHEPEWGALHVRAMEIQIFDKLSTLYHDDCPHIRALPLQPVLPSGFSLTDERHDLTEARCQTCKNKCVALCDCVDL